MLAITDVSIVIVVSSITGGIVSIIGAIFAGLAMLRAGHVQKEVRTFNELSIGQLGGKGETRRIEAIDPVDRSDQENRHMAMDVLDPEQKEKP